MGCWTSTATVRSTGTVRGGGGPRLCSMTQNLPLCATGKISKQVMYKPFLDSLDATLAALTSQQVWSCALPYLPLRHRPPLFHASPYLPSSLRLSATLLSIFTHLCPPPVCRSQGFLEDHSPRRVPPQQQQQYRGDDDEDDGEVSVQGLVLNNNRQQVTLQRGSQASTSLSNHWGGV